jgi:DNA mismatch repair protein MutS2
MGVPGESSALEIAAAAGFPQELLSRAKARIGTEWLDLAAKLRSIDDELARTREARRQAEVGKQEAARLRERLEEKMRVSLERMQTEEARSRVERERFVKEKRREIENLVRELRERGADKESVVAAKSAVERELREVAGEEAVTPAAPEGTPAVGDVVESLTFRRTGEVVAVATDGVTVAFGHIRMRLAPGDLVRVQSGARNQDADSAPVEPLRFDPRVDVRGLTRDEAWESVQRLLEEATVNGARELSILHGKGTGALRRMLWDALRRDPRVEAVRLAEESAGGSGVTLVAMRVQA